jgi:hypothetical protein
VPRATVNPDDTTTVMLKSLPEGEVVLRRMSYGQKLARQEQAVRMTMEQKKGSNKDSKMNMDMLQHAATVFDFRACIVSHNLQDADGKLLNLTQVQHIDQLDPRIGEEIAENINKMNNFEDAMEESDFPSESSSQ